MRAVARYRDPDLVARAREIDNDLSRSLTARAAVGRANDPQGHRVEELGRAPLPRSS